MVSTNQNRQTEIYVMCLYVHRSDCMCATTIPLYMSSQVVS